MELLLYFFFGWKITLAILFSLFLLFILCGCFIKDTRTAKERASCTSIPGGLPPAGMGSPTTCDFHSDRPSVARICCQIGKHRYRWYDMCEECHEGHLKRRYREMEKLDIDNAN